MEPTVADIADAPLPPGGPADAWQHYVSTWYAGRRADALTTLASFTSDLAAGPQEHRDAFAQWLCRLLFDRSQFWAGQWGGGIPTQGTRHERPAAPALTTHPLGAEIVLPYLLAAPPDAPGPHPRWLYQFAHGQGYRLPPAARTQLDSAVHARIGRHAPLAELLRHAPEDLTARRLLRAAETH